jgi:hypothetical protein
MREPGWRAMATKCTGEIAALDGAADLEADRLCDL